MSSRDELMTINAFSKRSRLSLKALRLYDNNGLLRPAVVDPSNGYRYYQADQVEKARIIGLLRRLDMPLRQIAVVLEMDNPAAASKVTEYWAEVESDLDTKRELVVYLRNRLLGREPDMYEIETRTVPQRRFVSIQRHLTADGLPEFIGQSIETLLAEVEKSDDEVAGAPYVIYHGEVDTDSDGPVEVCLPVAGTSYVPSGDIRVGTHPKHEEAYTTITKAQVKFPAILSAYRAVEDWLHANQMSPEQGLGPREVYFTDFESADPEDLVCDITFAIAG